MSNTSRALRQRVCREWKLDERTEEAAGMEGGGRQHTRKDRCGGCDGCPAERRAVVPPRLRVCVGKTVEWQRCAGARWQYLWE